MASKLRNIQNKMLFCSMFSSSFEMYQKSLHLDFKTPVLMFV